MLLEMKLMVAWCLTEPISLLASGLYLLTLLLFKQVQLQQIPY